jgi:hypothetical protein
MKALVLEDGNSRVGRRGDLGQRAFEVSALALLERELSRHGGPEPL